MSPIGYNVAAMKRLKAVKRSSPVSIRLTPEVDRPVRELARRTRRPLGRVINSLLETALRLEQFPGITFVPGPSGRRAHIPGTGLDVWEIVALVRGYGDPEAVVSAYPNLARPAIDLALAYAKAYPEDVEEFLAWQERSPDEILRAFPHVSVVRA